MKMSAFSYLFTLNSFIDFIFIETKLGLVLFTVKILSSK